jgi:hypothetical protein
LLAQLDMSGGGIRGRMRKNSNWISSLPDGRPELIKVVGIS